MDNVDKNKKEKKIQGGNKKYSLKIIAIIILIISCLIFFFNLLSQENTEYLLKQYKSEPYLAELPKVNLSLTNLETDQVTLVSCLYKIKSKHLFEEYKKWVYNLLQINKPLVFFIDPNISPEIKPLRPEKYKNKTIWIEQGIKSFYSYTHFYKLFRESKKIDEEHYHTVPLYLVWAEKAEFLRKVAEANYFNSTCFYWIDSGYFREENFNNVYLNWPSPKKCLEDPRIIFNSIREIKGDELKQLENIELTKNYFRQVNTGAGIFGGQYAYILKFHNLYYNSILKFYNKDYFIGKEQNIFTYVIYTNKNVCNLIKQNDQCKYDGIIWYYLKCYLM